LRNRVAARQAANASISEADVSVLEHQLETSDRLTDAERRRTASIDTEITLNTQEILEQIQAIRHSPQRASDLAGKLLH
jgi:hypothetical protein